MISEATILVLITILITLFFQPDLLTQWNTFSKEKKEELTNSVQDFVKEIKKGPLFQDQTQNRTPQELQEKFCQVFDSRGNSDDSNMNPGRYNQQKKLEGAFIDDWQKARSLGDRV